MARSQASLSQAPSRFFFLHPAPVPVKQTLKRPRPRMSYRCNEVHDHSVQALEQVGVGVDARGREAAEGAREVEQEVALAEVAAPVLEGDDGVRVLVEHLWQG